MFSIWSSISSQQRHEAGRIRNGAEWDSRTQSARNTITRWRITTRASVTKDWAGVSWPKNTPGPAREIYEKSPFWKNYFKMLGVTPEFAAEQRPSEEVAGAILAAPGRTSHSKSIFGYRKD